MAGLLDMNTPGGLLGSQPQQDPAMAEALNQPSTGFAMSGPPLVADPNYSSALLQAGIGVLKANQAGQGFSGILANGLQGYSNDLIAQKERGAEQRRQMLTDYALLGQIKERQMTQNLMGAKMGAISRLKELHPEMANMIDMDPEGVISAMTANMTPKYEKMGMGDTLVKIVNGVPTVVSGGSLAGPTGQAADLGGDEYMNWLKQNNPSLASDTQMALRGDYPITSMGTRNPRTAMVMEAANRIDPTFSPTTYKARMDAASDFSSKGKSGQLLTSINTAAGHLADAQKAFDQMQNGGFTWWNATKNAVDATYDNKTHDALNKFQTTVDALAPELAKISSGNPQVPEGEINERRDRFSPSQGPEAMRATLQEAASLIKSRSDALLSTHEQNLGSFKPKTFQPFSADALKSFQSLGVDLSNPSFADDPAAAPVAPASGQASLQGAPGPIINELSNAIDGATSKSGQAAAGNAITVPGAPGLKLPALTPAPPVKGAKLAPDGNWYVADPARPGKFLMVK